MPPPGKQLASDHPFVLYVAGAVALQQGAVVEAIRAAQEAQQFDTTYADAVLLEPRGLGKGRPMGRGRCPRRSGGGGAPGE